jgi:hypothetical protein
VQIVSNATIAKLRAQGVEGDRYLSGWHVDNHGSDGSHNAHWLFLVVRKAPLPGAGPGAARQHANLCVAPTGGVDRCDGPRARMRPGIWWHGLWERLACCPALAPGDAVLYREDVAHRTQDQAIDRLGMVVKIEADRPQDAADWRPEDALCDPWARSSCETHPKFMRCACPNSCPPQRRAEL